MLSKLYKKNGIFKKYNKSIFLRGGDHHGGKNHASHDKHDNHEHHGEHDDHHDDHHHESALGYGGGKWYEMWGNNYDPPRKYNLHGEIIGEKRIIRFYEVPILLAVGLSLTVTFGFLFFFPYEYKSEWAIEEIKIRKAKREQESEDKKNLRKEMIQNYILSDTVEQVKLDKVDYPSVWLNNSFDRFLETKSMDILRKLNRESSNDYLNESKIIEEGYTIYQNLKIRNESNKEIDLLQYLISSSGNDLYDIEKNQYPIKSRSFE